MLLVSCAIALLDAADEPKATTKSSTSKAANLDVLQKMRQHEDKIEGVTWYHDKSTSSTPNRNNVYLYIGRKGAQVWLRLRMQYAGDSWLFINGFIVAADDKRFERRARFQRDYHTTIWEWHDTVVGQEELEIVQAIIAAKNVTIRYSGDKYYSDRKVSPQEKQALKNVLDAYAALRGVADTHPEPRLYQVTGSVLGLTNDVITVKKDIYNEKWEVGQNKETTVNGRLTIGSRVTILYKLLATSIDLKSARMDTPSSGPRSYQVTGPLVKLNDDFITVAKDNEQWEMRRNSETKINGQFAIGSRVSVAYKMSAMSIDVK